MAGRKPSRPTFAEMVTDLPEPAMPTATWLNSIPRPWITVEGERWHLRGDASHEGKELHKLLGQQDLLAFHEYMDRRSAIAPDEREPFWRRALSLMEASEFSHFVGYEYTNADRGRCLVIYESC